MMQHDERTRGIGECSSLNDTHQAFCEELALRVDTAFRSCDKIGPSQVILSRCVWGYVVGSELKLIYPLFNILGRLVVEDMI